MTRIWFNHWFSTSYRLIELIKKDVEDVYIIGSNKEQNAVIQLVCDEWYKEPDLKGQEYIDYCLDFCKKNAVDVFVPRKEMVNISKHKTDFEAIGVSVMVDDYDIIHILNDKVSTYELFKESDIIKVPDYYMATNVSEFKDGFHKLKKQGYDVCIKFVRDEGGLSFRRIVDNVDRSIASLRRYPGCELSYDELVTMLSGEETFDELMIMPYLPAEEISVDCLSTEHGLIAVPRIKGYARHEIVSFDPQILSMVESIMDRIKLQYPCNIQFKCKDGVMYLLEINTRMSGGLQMTCEAASVNIPAIALNKILGRSTQWTMNKHDGIVSYIELPRIIK